MKSAWPSLRPGVFLCAASGPSSRALKKKSRSKRSEGEPKRAVALFYCNRALKSGAGKKREKTMNRIIWAVGAIVIILAILSYAGFR